MSEQNLDRLLEAAVVVSWPELMRGAHAGLVHLEYTLSTSRGIDSLQVWSSVRRGYWLLACTYDKSGIHFDNGYQSEGLAHNIAIVMEHQNAFTLHPTPVGQRVLEIAEPTETETIAAAATIADALNGLSSAFTGRRLATA